MDTAVAAAALWHFGSAIGTADLRAAKMGTRS